MAMTAWSTTAANNVLANTGINMDEGMAPSAVNDSIREIMAVLKTSIDTGSITATGTTFNLLATVATTVNAFGAASVALNIGHASAAAAFPGGISIPIGKTLSGAGAIDITGGGTFGSDLIGTSGSASDPWYLYHSGTTGVLHLSGGGGGSGNIQLFASAHATLAKSISIETNSVERINVSSTGVIKISNLAGSGTRAVVVDANGVLSAP